ncbi:hypothetical protein Q6D67_15470 [Haliea sp. E1-2-M8]|uniref:DUF6691 family protein n=1 Tax=Haliea sp. E1-2-M8 TaxID=3064706 RepID=UPI002728053A|nr:DUF6691 family protein [Haliea sp. E1-2-M8]MDO8863105.1 hypothetical protein [Haliea sp. E1-2-M8]
MKSTLSSLIAGLLFGAGLLLSGMVNPSKVIGFLDIAGVWDPSLALVMVSAILVSWIGVQLALRRAAGADADADAAEGAPQRDIDRPLLIGSALFGIGWGITGFCPGPAVAALGMGFWPAAVVAIGLLPGLWVGNRLSG